jgi:hypothetical protein
VLPSTDKDNSQQDSDRIEAEMPIRTTFLVDRELLPNCIAERTDIPLSQFNTFIDKRNKLATNREMISAPHIPSSEQR